MVGRYPPPYGGVTVHIQRLHQTLLPDWDVTVFDVYPPPPTRSPGSSAQSAPSSVRRGRRFAVATLFSYRRLVAAGCFDIVHFHSSTLARFLSVGWPLLLCARWSGARTLVTIHGGDFTADCDRAGALGAFFLRRLLSLFHHVVAVNKEQGACLTGKCRLADSRVSVIPAFLPPSVAEEGRLAGQLQGWRAAGRRVLCSSGAGIALYGFHDMVSAARRVDETRPCALVVAIDYAIDEAYLQALESAAGALPLVIVRGMDSAELAWLLKRSDLYLRCSDRDGDAMAVREALYLGTPVVASDCVERPAGVATYAVGDVGALVGVLQAALAEPARPASAGDSASNCGVQLQAVYREVLRS